MERGRDERGFTLVEVLSAVAILGIIMVALGGAFSIGFRGLDSTSNRLVSSNDAQLVSVNFPPDVQSANAVPETKTAGITCNGVTSAKIQLASTESEAIVRIVVYWVSETANGDYELVRSLWNTDNCSGASEDTVVARNVAGPAEVSAQCSSGECKITIKEKASATDPIQYQFTVAGQMRS